MSTYTASLPFRLGEPHSFRSLALVPLFAAREPSLEYVGLDEAAVRGLRVTEVDQAGAVESLFVVNPLPANVLLYEGEELVGAKQNRILDRTILVQARSKVSVPVNCVERGRWSYRSAAFSPAPRAAHPDLRLAKHLGARQGEVWQHLSEKSARLASFSPTEAAEQMYVDRGATLEEHLAALPREDGQCGAVVCIAGRVVCVDFVGRSEVWAGLHAKLLRGYALDALERPAEAPVPLEYVEQLLARIARARRMPGEVVGLGAQRRVRGARVVGTELVVGDETVALTVFPRAPA